MFRSDRRLFSIASIGLIVVGAIHGAGMFTPPPADPALHALLQAMEDYRFDFVLLGMKPPFLSIYDSLNAFMAIALAGWGAQNLAIAKADGAEGRVVRRTARISALTLGIVVAMFYSYGIVPPFVTLLVVEFLFVFAVIRLRKAAAAA